MMLGRLILRNLKTKEIIKIYDYEQLSNDREEKDKIRKTYSKEEYSLQCGCNTDIHMWIKSDSRLYYKNTEYGKSKHNCSCYGHFNYKELIRDPGWKEDEDRISVTLDFSLIPKFTKDKNESNQNICDDKSYSINKKVYKFGENVGKLGASALGKKINLYTWQKIALKEQMPPTDILSMTRKVWGNSNFIKLNNKVTLKDIFYDGKYKNMDKKESRFVYGELKDIKPHKYYFDDNLIEVFVELGIGLTCSINLDLSLLMEQLISLEILKNTTTIDQFKVAITNDKVVKKIISEKLVMSGFIGIKRRFVQFYELGMFKVTKNGLFTESSYETKLYDELCDAGILFYKPYKKIPIYNMYCPDAIIVAPNKKKVIFIEVFGFKSKDYIEKKHIKEALFRDELKNSHVLISWDICENNEPMPKIEEIKRIISEIEDYK